MEHVLGAFQVRLDYYNRALSRGERVLDGDSAALRDETAAARAEDPPEEIPAEITQAEVPMDEDPADVEEDVPADTAEMKVPLHEVPAAPASPAPPEEEDQEALLHESRQLYQRYLELDEGEKREGVGELCQSLQLYKRYLEILMREPPASPGQRGVARLST